MTMAKTTVLLVNLGTPDNPSVGKVRSYLSQFLNDPRVIDIPWLIRKILVNLIIVPFRAPKSAAIYKELWTDEGSPIITHGNAVKRLLQEKLGSDYTVELAMRYKNPSIPSVLDRIHKSNPNKIIVIPLFPHYASASTGSALEAVMDEIKRWWVIPELSFVSQYWDHPKYIEAFVERGNQYNWKDYDHVIFSYHGLPERQVDKVYNEGLCNDRDCLHEVNDENKYCYKATCYGTTRLIAEKMNPEIAPYFSLAVAHRPALELYDIQHDPACLNDLSGESEHQELTVKLEARLNQFLKTTGDPRLNGDEDVWEKYIRYSRIRSFPAPAWAK